MDASGIKKLHKPCPRAKKRKIGPDTTSKPRVVEVIIYMNVGNDQGTLEFYAVVNKRRVGQVVIDFARNVADSQVKGTQVKAK